MMDFYCTAGRGNELFVAKELALRMIDKDAKVTDGKVYFKCCQGLLKKLQKMKSAERVFVQIEHLKTSEITATGRYQFLQCLKEKLVRKHVMEEVLDTYRQTNETSDTGCEEPLTKKQRLDAFSPTFRVSTRVSGRWGKLFKGKNSREVSQSLGVHIVKMLGWTVELRNPDFEICVHINDDVICAGVPISRQPVSKRAYIVQSGLRSTTAWIMAHLADIQTGDIVLDPMCGKGTILVEAGVDFQTGHYVGMDISADQTSHSSENRVSACIEGRLDLAISNVTYLPVRSGSVDKIVCDAPFGQKHTTDMDIEKFYRILIQQIHRVLRVGGKAVVMTSADLKNTLLSMVNHSQDRSKTQVETKDSMCVETNKDLEDTELKKPEDSSPSSDIKERCDTVKNSQRLQGTDAKSVAMIPVTDNEGQTCSDLLTTDSRSNTDGDEKSNSQAGAWDQIEKTNKVELCVVNEHYVKLGETHAFIFVLEKES